MRIKTLGWITTSLFLSVGVSSEMRQYESDLDVATWAFEGTPVHCELSHDIELFGRAQFFARASRTPNMAFVLDSTRNRLATDQKVAVRNLPASWRPQQRAREVTTTWVIPGEKTVNLVDNQAWSLLVGLERGYSPSFFTEDLSADLLAVSLSPANFQVAYRNFLDCVEGLLPYDFHEIQYTMVNFAFDRSEVTKVDREKLEVLAEFLKHDSGIDRVMIEGHTDSIALRGYNDRLGMRRANEIKDVLVSFGVDKNKIKVASYGERRPLESNASEEGRSINRRVFITMQQG